MVFLSIMYQQKYQQKNKLGIDLTKNVHVLYGENHEIPLEDLRESLRNEANTGLTEGTIQVTATSLPKLTYSLHTVLIKTLTRFINETDALIIEFMRKQRPRIATTHVKELPRGHDLL